MPRTIRITYAPTTEEVAYFQRLLAQRHTGDSPAWTGNWIVMTALAVLSVGAGFLGVGLGLVTFTAGGFICLSCCVTCFATYYIRERLVRRYHLKVQEAWYARTIARNYEVELTEAGVSEHTGYRILTFRWPGIEQVVVRGEMLLLWTSDKRAIVVPLRAIVEAERDAVVAFALGRGHPATASPDQTSSEVAPTKD